jgi:hypothetical protein
VKTQRKFTWLLKVNFLYLFILSCVSQEFKPNISKNRTSKKVKSLPKQVIFEDPLLIRIPEGRFLAGSAPGSPNRDPSSQMDEVPVFLSEFMIDREPFFDTSNKPKVNVSYYEAKRLCKENKKRLCRELEWERACKGKFGLKFEGILEWTDDFWGEIKEDREKGITVRDQRRGCSFRTYFPPKAKGPRLGFRCCKGKRNSQGYKMPEKGRPFRFVRLEIAELREILASVPEAEMIAQSAHFFSPNDLNTIIGGRYKKDAHIWRFTIRPFRWIPKRGEELLVLIGRSNQHGFIFILYELPDRSYRHAASLILKDDPRAMMFILRRNRREFEWKPCFKCYDGGRVIYKDNRIIITHR